MTNIEKPIYISREEKNGLTKELLKKLFDYKDGFLYYKTRPTNSVHIGEMAGGLHKKINRFCIGINGKHYLYSRIIFLWHNGWLPEVIDHKDRNPLNDRIENLRPATRTENNQNSTSRKNKTSEYLGVSKKYNKWLAQIQINGKPKFIGYFDTQIEAALAYDKVAIEKFKEFANPNILKP